MRGEDNVGSDPFDGPIPASQPTHLKDLQQEPFQSAWIYKQAIREHADKSEFKCISDQYEGHQTLGNNSSMLSNIEKSIHPDNQHQQREHHDKVNLIEKGGEHDDCRTTSDTDPLFVNIDDGYTGSADSRWGNGRGKLPQHDDPKGLQPRQFAAAQHPDSNDVTDIPAKHEQHRQKQPSDGCPRKGDIGKDFGIKIPPQHPPHNGQADQDRIDGIANLDFAQGAASGLVVRHRYFY